MTLSEDVDYGSMAVACEALGNPRCENNTCVAMIAEVASAGEAESRSVILPPIIAVPAPEAPAIVPELPVDVTTEPAVPAPAP